MEKQYFFQKKLILKICRYRRQFHFLKIQDKLELKESLKDLFLICISVAIKHNLDVIESGSDGTNQSRDTVFSTDDIKNAFSKIIPDDEINRVKYCTDLVETGARYFESKYGENINEFSWKKFTEFLNND